jgi:hypothetical protein
VIEDSSLPTISIHVTEVSSSAPTAQTKPNDKHELRLGCSDAGAPERRNVPLLAIQELARATDHPHGWMQSRPWSHIPKSLDESIGTNANEESSQQSACPTSLAVGAVPTSRLGLVANGLDKAHRNLIG